MNGTIKVKGGIPLKGEVIPVPNKNAILGALPAAILTDKDVIFHNVPKSTDVELMIEMMKKMGANVDDSDYNNLKINCKSLHSYKIDKELGERIRASIMFVGPLLTRFGKAEVPVPGGCVLGMRSIAAHVEVFSKVDVKVEYKDGVVEFISPKDLKPDYLVWQSEASVTATENFILYAAGTDSNFEIIDAASEPHVTEVAELVVSMGAKINGIGSNKLEISGTKNLSGGDFIPSADHVDIVGYIVAAALTKGHIRIKNANDPKVAGIYLNWFPKFGVGLKTDGADLVIDGSHKLEIDIKNSGFPMAGPDMPKFVPRPWPGFPVDCLPPVITLACKVEGRVLFYNWMYETGLDFAKHLNAMGANIEMIDPQKVIVNGPITFRSDEVTSPEVIQGCMAIFLAALTDPVETTIHGVDVLKRRYPNIFECYKKLGADIEYS